MNHLLVHIFSRFLSTLAFQTLSFYAFYRVFEITGSAVFMGAVGLALFVPTFILNFYGGALIDRISKTGKYYFLISWAQVLLPLILIFSGGAFYSLISVVLIMSVLRCFRSPLYYSVLSEVHLRLRKKMSPEVLARLNTVSWQLPLIVAPSLVAFFSQSSMSQSFLQFSAGSFVGLNALLVPVYFALILQTLSAALTVVNYGVQGRAAASKGLKSLLSFYYKNVFQNKKLFVPLVVDAMFACLLGLSAFLPFLLSSHEMSPEKFGYFKSLFHFSGIMFVTFTPIKSFKNYSLKNLVYYSLVWVLLIQFLVFTGGGVALTIGIIVLGLMDGLSILYRDSLIFKLTAPEDMGRVSSLNSFLISVGDEFGEFSTGGIIEVMGPRSLALLNLGLGAVVGRWAWSASNESETSKIEISKGIVSRSV